MQYPHKSQNPSCLVQFCWVVHSRSKKKKKKTTLTFHLELAGAFSIPGENEADCEHVTEERDLVFSAVSPKALLLSLELPCHSLFLEIK